MRLIITSLCAQIKRHNCEYLKGLRIDQFVCILSETVWTKNGNLIYTMYSAILYALIRPHVASVLGVFSITHLASREN
jgi:hypothetical protein